ncbi:outer membrane protein assembly factor BamA [Variovorax paradoxus]|jgi:outer membrane protein insertion porin family|uniref:outer membrane protein assembly factor BamA n=1 Tax=Variovorax paradoxus TaxID=34073 RepID=UPI0006E67ACF|nr:outer membrane protein assembly factor BamA [Variovorax paradoxus]KPV08835.1 outer membrane protein assembly factor BamA [Variovorax paradoxus]KPV11332.1 outer membrane protein assembly factor BamA [Variovorax paradoxus]KPV23223.1 outer membrane protein assembly factor BamA [Variovorax paradoxus]KPV26766.1 outer membrane protein assembly factor BamA [Variovorax paradoxus]
MKSPKSLAGLALLAALIAPSTRAAEPFAVQDIRLEGLQRVEAGTVFATLGLRAGDTYSDERGSEAIRALFALGLFKDVRIDVSGRVLVVIVEERPTIADVDFTGTKEFDKAALQKALREVGLAEGRPYDKALADRAEQELKRQYLGRGLYNAQVVTTATPTERNRVNLSFGVTEGEPARIREVRIVGGRDFSESTLLDLFDQDSGGWLSWYTKSNQYSRARLDADLEALKSYYITRGYLEFRVDSTQVAISPDRQDLAITVNITEGEKFTVAGVKLAGDYLGRDDEFKTLVTVRPGEPYNGEQVAATTKAFTDYFGTFGYAFARVKAEPEIDRARHRVTMVLRAEPARRAYVRRIHIGGNARTRDEVIRREFRQYEGAWYDGNRIKLSRDRVDRLGFFTDVNVETQEIPGSPDQVDIAVTVAEKPTGSLQLGAGYSSTDKISLSFGITQENVFGSGNYLGLQVNTSSYNRTISVTATDPYFSKDGISRTFNLFHTTTRPYYEADGNYKLASDGGSVRFGIPVGELDRIYLGIGVERYAFTPGSNGSYTLVDGSYVYTATPQAYLDYFQCTGTAPSVSCANRNVVAFPATLGWSRDDRDSALIPTRGRLQSANLEVGVGGALRYLKSNYQYQQYFPLSKQYTLAFNGELGYARALGDSAFPIFKNFYAGGLGSIRGFEQNSLGPRDAVTEGALGGTRKAIFNLEFSTPFPGAGNDRSLRLYSFLDAGNVFASRTASMSDAQWKAQNRLRASAGLGISWISPLGPLRLAYAVPLRYQKEDTANGIAADRTQRLQFQIGTAF